MQDALKRHDTVLYSDGDIRWYGKYPLSGHSMAIFPHQITNDARKMCKHNLFTSGVANIGILEMSRGADADGVFDFVVTACMKYPQRLMNGQLLWLQPFVSCIPDCGYDCVWNCHPGVNVAAWNLRTGDRGVVKQDGKYYSVIGSSAYPLVSFHFSAHSFKTLDNYGNAVKELRDAYLRDH